MPVDLITLDIINCSEQQMGWIAQEAPGRKLFFW